MKIAAQLRGADMVTGGVQLLPVHPANTELESVGVAVSVTMLLSSMATEHVPVFPVAQLNPELVTVPEPLPPIVTVMSGLNRAVQACAAFMVNASGVLVDVLQVAPAQPAKDQLLSASASSCTIWSVVEKT